MTTWMRIVGLCVGATALAACTVADTSAADEDVESQEDSIYAATTTLWSNKSIPVCWENPGSNGTQRGWVKDSITKSWDAASTVNFTGWGTCAATSSGIRIKIDDSGPHTKGLGKQLNGVAAGMVLNFTFNNWSTACHGQEESCIRSIAVHEFGHALGFAHEQNRKDKPSTCSSEPQGGDGDMVVGKWDLSSVMNYCNPQYNGNGNLSQTDVIGVKLAYDTGLGGLIINQTNDKCLDVKDGSTANGARVLGYPCQGTNNQRWNAVKRADGYYQLINRNSGKCLDVTDVSTANGAPMQQWDCAGSDNQAWAITSGGLSPMRAKHSGKCLDVPGSTQADNAQIQQWTCNGTGAQNWILKN